MRKPADAPTDRPDQRGAALLSALLILGLLVFVLTSLASLIVNRSSVTAIDRDREAIEALTISGLEMGVYRVMMTARDIPVEGSERVVLNDGEARVSWRGENARIDLNSAPPAWIAGLISAVSPDTEHPEQIAQTIAEQRQDAARRNAKPTDLKPTDLKPEDLRERTIRDGPFAHPAELLSRQVVSPDLYRRLLPYITVYSGSSSMDPRLASETVLAHLPDMTPVRLGALLSLHGQTERAATAVLEDFGISRSMLAAQRSLTTRFTVQVRLKNGVQHSSEIVAAIYPNDAEPYRILYWSSVPRDR